jgi:hypothetical protein
MLIKSLLSWRRTRDGKQGSRKSFVLYTEESKCNVSVISMPLDG